MSPAAASTPSGSRPPASTLAELLAELATRKDYPTAPNCTSPFAPIWIGEMVRRRQSQTAG